MADSKAQKIDNSTKSNAKPVGTKSKKQSTEFLALNDSCCLEIFKYLPLNDVCALSQTCRRMYALGSNHFMLNYESKVLVYIDSCNLSFNGGLLHTFPYMKDANYASCFAEKIQNVTLLKHFSTIQAMKELNTIYQCGNDDENSNVSAIKTLRLLDWKVPVSRALCTPITAILKNVESFTVENISIDVDLNNRLFAFMPNLKQLTVLTFPDRQTNDVLSNITWLQQACPTLEYFSWHVAPNHQRPEAQFPAMEIEQFLKLNSGIKFVSLRLDSKEQLNILMASDITVSELFFTMNKCGTDITEIIADLMVICESRKSMDRTKQTRLHLQINGYQFKENPGQLEFLAPYIVGLYFESFVLKCFAPVFPKLINLQVLQAIEYVPAVELLCLLPSLDEMYISCLRKPISYYENDIRMLATRLPKLKKLFLNRYLYRCFNNLLVDPDYFGEENFKYFGEINAKRKKFPSVKKLKVYLEVEQDLDEVKTDYDTMEIVRSQTEAITNPFVQPTHLANAVAAPDTCVIQ